jgi:ketosteroid isomerase-like protein
MTNRLWEGLNLMKAIILLFVLLLTLELPSVAAQQPDSSPVETVTTFFADWNMGAIQAASKLFAPQPSLTDVFPRFHWQGKNAFRKFFSDLDIYNASQGFTDYEFDVGTPTNNDIEGANASVIVPVVLNLKHDGQPQSYPGLVNLVLRRNGASWKIVSFTWTSTD